MSRPYDPPPLPILSILGAVIRLVRRDHDLSASLDALVDREPDRENVAVRWLSQRKAFEVTLIFDAATLVTAAAEVAAKAKP